MTPAEETAIQSTIEYITHKSINDGIMVAVEMIRHAATHQSKVDLNKLADAIENTVIKDQCNPPSFLQP